MSGFQFTREGLVPLAGSSTPGAEQTASGPEKKASGKTTKPSDPINVIKLAKARLREVEREIKRLTFLAQERDELRRLLDAATNKPRAVVRDIKAARG